MADSKLTALSEVSLAELEDLLYLVEDPAGTPTSRKISAQRLLGLLPFTAGGRLTLTTALPVTTADVTAAGTLFYTPYIHTHVRVWDGTRWLLKNFSEISLALTLTSGKNYDVFLDDDAATLVLSAAWTNDTTRADALGTQNGIPVLNSDKTKLWLGTIRASGANTTEDSRAKRFLWNAYHRRRRALLRQESTESWTWGTAGFHQANANAANQVETVTGKAEDAIELNLAMMAVSNAFDTAGGIGQNSTSAIHADCVGVYDASVSVAAFVTTTHRLTAMPRLGYDAWTWLEYGHATPATFYGHRTTAGGTPIESGLSGTCYA